MLNEETRNQIFEIARERRMDAVALMAVIDVESAGRIFANVSGKREPLIRFEGHYFYRLLDASKRNQAVVKGLADRRAGRVKNPRTQAGRWRLLHKARSLDHAAALESTSWGIGQVMGSHWRWLDFASVDAMVARARTDFSGQAELMVRYIEKAGLLSAIEQRDWRGFARGYNGPAYAKNRYDVKLASAYQRYQDLMGGEGQRKTGQRSGALTLRFGDRGAAVKDLQTALRKCGLMLAVDSDFGPATRRMVQVFQKENGLVVDGIVGPKTFGVLSRYH